MAIKYQRKMHCSLMRALPLKHQVRCSAIPSAFFSLHPLLYSVMFLPRKHQVCAVLSPQFALVCTLYYVLWWFCQSSFVRTFRACVPLFPPLGVIITRLFSWFALFSNMFPLLLIEYFDWCSGMFQVPYFYRRPFIPLTCTTRDFETGFDNV